MSIAENLYAAAFDEKAHRDPRSEAYKCGVSDALAAAESGGKIKLKERFPYALGTAEADAWFFGTQEGLRRWREYREGR